jgi:hypothetical protein
VLSSPAYFANLGSGDVVWNTVTHAILAVSAIVLGSVLGGALGGRGVVLGWTCSLFLAAAFTVFEHRRRSSLRLGELLSSREIGMIVVNALALVLAVSLPFLFSGRIGLYPLTFAQVSVFGVSGALVIRSYGPKFAGRRSR